MGIYVDEIKYKDNVLKCNANIDIAGLNAAARMIVDSDNMQGFLGRAGFPAR